MRISVVVATHGSEEWRQLSERAVASAERQAHAYGEDWTRPEVVAVHLAEGTVAEARNLGALDAHGDYLIFLDGDDEMAPGYVDAMSLAAATVAEPEWSLFVPTVSYVSRHGQRTHPKFWPEVKVENGNWLVIGTMVPRALFLDVGGFEEWPIYEDWALFARMQKAGATPVRVPPAVYLAHRREGSRNHSLDRAGKLAAHESIRRAIWPELYEEEA